MDKLKGKGWAIKGDFFGKGNFYIGWWLTRSEAIRGHCKDTDKTWEDCKKYGDRVVKIIIWEA